LSFATNTSRRSKRWGGSLEQMLDFERQARATGLSPMQLQYFANTIAVERKWLQQRAR
jgi:hypothetical protein